MCTSLILGQVIIGFLVRDNYQDIEINFSISRKKENQNVEEVRNTNSDAPWETKNAGQIVEKKRKI